MLDLLIPFDTDRLCARLDLRAHPRHTHEQLCTDPACALSTTFRPQILKSLHSGDDSCKLDHAHFTLRTMILKSALLIVIFNDKLETLLPKLDKES